MKSVTIDRYRLFAFMASVVSIYERLSTKGQKRLRGMILGGLRDNGLTPLQQEMGVAAHLFWRGFDVFFSDIETGLGGFDFLATKDGIEIEVECKRIGLSLGRKIALGRSQPAQAHTRSGQAPIRQA